MGSAGISEDGITLPSTFDPDIEPIQLRRNNTFGYYIVASRHIKATELIVEDTPLMICPCTGKKGDEFICLTCFKICNSNCSICTWPVCGQNCERGKIHSNFECRILSRNKVLFSNPKHDYTAVKILRCLLLRDENPDKWNLLVQHDSQLHNRSQDIKTKEAREHILNFIMEKCQLGNAFDDDTIEMVAGICATNEFCLMLNEYSRETFVIFHKVSYLTHSCEPNSEAIWKFHPTQTSSYSTDYFSVKFFASRDIEPGEMLTHSYIPETNSVEKRQNFLDAHYYFKCDCERCRKELFYQVAAED